MKDGPLVISQQNPQPEWGPSTPHPDGPRHLRRAKAALERRLARRKAKRKKTSTAAPSGLVPGR